LHLSNSDFPEKPIKPDFIVRQRRIHLGRKKHKNQYFSILLNKLENKENLKNLIVR